MLLHAPMQVQPQMSKQPTLCCLKVVMIVVPQTSVVTKPKPMNKAGLLYNFYHFIYMKTCMPCVCVSSEGKEFVEKDEAHTKSVNNTVFELTKQKWVNIPELLLCAYVSKLACSAINTGVLNTGKYYILHNFSPVIVIWKVEMHIWCALINTFLWNNFMFIFKRFWWLCIVMNVNGILDISIVSD